MNQQIIIRKLKKILKYVSIFILTILVIVLLVPQNFMMPVEGATKADYNPETFWYYPWGNSITHKGIDIFAEEGVNVKACTGGIVIFSGKVKRGGNTILILGPKWRFHYYAHLKERKVKDYTMVSRGEIIGTVGSTGNAVGKEPHLHYSIFTPLPYLWRIDNDKQGWKKIFYLNPIDYLPDSYKH
jgi:peptidoglycan LD-endopeptidase LytH